MGVSTQSAVRQASTLAPVYPVYYMNYSPMCCMWVVLPDHQLPLSSAPKNQLTTSRSYKQLNCMILQGKATTTLWLCLLYPPLIQGIASSDAIQCQHCAIKVNQPAGRLMLTSSWLGSATNSVTTAGALGSRAATLPALPLAHHWFTCGRWATLIGLLLRPSNLSRHLRA